MKYVIFSFNYPTLCRALRYIDEEWGRDNSTLIFASMVSEIPHGVLENYHVKLVDGYERSKIHSVKGVIADILLSYNAWSTLKKVADQIDGEFTFVVFRDNEAPEAAMIDNAVSRYADRMHLWIIEEGVGVYAMTREPVKKAGLKRIAYTLAGVSRYSLVLEPQGKHKALEKVIVARPEAVKEKYKDIDVIVEKQLDVFVPAFNKRFAEYVLGQSAENEQYAYVFLTTPFTDIPAEQYTGGTAGYEAYLRKLISVVTKHGNMVIKSHPRDYFDYSAYEAAGKVKVCTPQENSIPYECLAAYYGYPRILTFGSSACISGAGEKSSIYIQHLLENADFSDAFLADEYYRENNIVVARTFEELDQLLQE